MNEKSWQIAIYCHPDSGIGSFLTSTEISEYRVKIFRRPLGREADAVVKELGVIGEQVVTDVLAFPEGCSISPRMSGRIF